jgi:hypothetical protein
MNPDVISVTPEADFCLRVTFVTGEVRRFDVKPYLNYPVFQKLAHLGYFTKAHVENGTVVWDEHTDLSPDTLYLQSVAV